MSETYDVTVLYKGQPILALNDTGIKALRTSGKYVEGDFTVSYTKPETGIDTSDATLTSGSQMLDGVTAYADGVKITGTIQTWSPPVIEEITFQIYVGIKTNTYTAENGMTWAQWVNSSYNSTGFYVLNGSVFASDGNSIGGVTSNDLIVANRIYTTSGGSGGGAND